MRKIFSPLLLVVMIGLAGYLGYFFYYKDIVIVEASEDIVEANFVDSIVDSILEAKIRDKEYTILLAGDVMLDRGVEGKVMKHGGGDFTFPWQLISEKTNAADIFFFNHEGAMSDIGQDTGKEYSFNFELKAKEGMKYAGADVVALANNHGLDWGRDALCDTISELKEAGISQVGAGCTKEESDTPYIVELGETKIAFMAVTEFYKEGYARDNAAGFTKFDKEEIVEKTKILKEEEGVDVVIVSIHFGEEYKTRSNSFQQDFAKYIVDGGVDLVVGHHPHVVQEVEKYKDGWILYSLGNFIFDQYQPGTREGLMAEVVVAKGGIQDVVLIPIGINEYSQPYIK